MATSTWWPFMRNISSSLLNFLPLPAISNFYTNRQKQPSIMWVRAEYTWYMDGRRVSEPCVHWKRMWIMFSMKKNFMSILYTFFNISPGIPFILLTGMSKFSLNFSEALLPKRYNEVLQFFKGKTKWSKFHAKARNEMNSFKNIIICSAISQHFNFGSAHFILCCMLS